MSVAIQEKITVPDKWDIIPLHTSDRTTFKDCRRRWAWSSPAQQNLVPKVSIYGLYLPFWFGTGIHYALEKHYDPFLSEDAEVAWETWFNLQWLGGQIKESEFDEFADRKPYEKDGKWFVQGLSDVLPMPDVEEFQMLLELGKGMMRNYKDYAERNDDFDVISTEHIFSVPVMDPTTGKPLYMLDTREMPESWEPTDQENIYGPLMYEDISQTGPNCLFKQVHARGRMDLIVLGRTTENYAIIDHKTADTIGDDYFDHTDLDEQCTTYIWAAEIEAQMHDLPYKDIAGIVYQAIRKAYPSPPTITSRGIPSLNKTTESTTPALFEKTIKEMGLEEYFKMDEKMQAYYTFLVDKGDKTFIQRHPVRRNRHQKDNAGLRLYMEAMDMLDNPRIYPNPTKNYSCLRCRFRGPCVAIESGYDWEDMIKDGYETNFDR
jgi:hypothetical protein